MNLHLKWSELPGHLRKVLVPALIITILVGVGGFMLSFQALSDWAASTGLFPPEWSWIFPLVVDGGLVFGELLTVAAMIVAAPKLFPATIMGIFGAATVWINLIHAPAEWGVRITAILPPAATICATLGIAWLGKHTAEALGMDLTYTPPPPPRGGGLPVPGHLARPDAYPWQLPPGYAPWGYGGYAPGLPHPMPHGANGDDPAGQPADAAYDHGDTEGGAARPPDGAADAATAGFAAPPARTLQPVGHTPIDPAPTSGNEEIPPPLRPTPSPQAVGAWGEAGADAASPQGHTGEADRRRTRPKTGGARRLSGRNRQPRPTPEELQARHERAEAFVLEHLAATGQMPSHSAIARAAHAPDKSWGRRFLRDHGDRLQDIAQGRTNVLQLPRPAAGEQQ